MNSIYKFDDWREHPDTVNWSLTGISYIPLNILREFKDYIYFDGTYGNPYRINFFNLLRLNKNIDIDFIREFIGELDIYGVRQVISILDSQGYSPRQYGEFLRMWVDWNVKNRSEHY